MIGFLKRNLFNIICGVVAVAAIGLGVLGITSMGKVEEELLSIASIHGQFSGPTSRPVNDRIIESERQRVETITQQYGELIARAKALNTYEPLKPGEGERFFPEPSSNGRRQFREVYDAQFTEFIQLLKTGMPPTESDVRTAQEAIDEERRTAQSFGDEDAGDRSRKPPQDEENTHPSGLISEKQASESASTRAAIQRALNIYCYTNPETFDRNASVFEGLSPREADMWKAQVSLWVQQDVVRSLARLNAAVAKEVIDAGGEPWVGNLPIKDILSIRVSDYLPVKETSEPRNLSGDGPSNPPGDGNAVFTLNMSNDMYEVVQFSLKMVIDARRLPQIIDEICKDRFHTLLNVAYEYDRSAFENLKMEGKVYGSDPAIKVVLDFETIFFGDLYRCQMPEAILNAIGKTCERAESNS